MKPLANKTSRPVYDRGGWIMTIGAKHLTASGRLTAVWTGKRQRGDHTWVRRELEAELPSLQNDFQRSIVEGLLRCRKWSPSDLDTACLFLFDSSVRAGPDTSLRRL